MSFIKYIFSVICGLSLLSNAGFSVTFDQEVFSINEQGIYKYVANKHLSTVSNERPYSVKDLESYINNQGCEGAKKNEEYLGIITQWQEDTKNLDIAQQTKLQEIFLQNIALKYFALGDPISELALTYPTIAGQTNWVLRLFLYKTVLDGIKSLITQQEPPIFLAYDFKVHRAADAKTFLENIRNEETRKPLSEDIEMFARCYSDKYNLVPGGFLKAGNISAIQGLLELTDEKAQAVRDTINSLPITFQEIDSAQPVLTTL